ncbi:hypothetical protein L6452_06941 [Arctium lappa]|uniref:Uncharacterized protein n=1 Tax=Arctium lappa TaxID=4217 RepID=A0ACB9EK19_ARCLA|nr:hypothetical protein L6452_06941 [Arctium lappa]
MFIAKSKTKLLNKDKSTSDMMWISVKQRQLNLYYDVSERTYLCHNSYNNFVNYTVHDTAESMSPKVATDGSVWDFSDLAEREVMKSETMAFYNGLKLSYQMKLTEMSPEIRSSLWYCKKV